MTFEEWWNMMIADNPLWNISQPNWRDVKAIAKMAFTSGEHIEFVRQLEKELRGTSK